jgi:hypothetical protein
MMMASAHSPPIGDAMTDHLSIHAFVFCWPGKEAGAHHIANSIADHVDYLTVLYKNDNDCTEDGPGDWRKIPNEWFYGSQFKHSLDLNQGSIMLHIQADAKFDHWPLIISKCKNSFDRFPNVGVWAPNVYHTVWIPEVTSICEIARNEIIAITATDGIVWALSSAVIDRLKMLDYDMNKFGWGISEAAGAFAFTNNMLVLMDLSVKVEHPKGSGYCNVEALEQVKGFIDQLSVAERVQFNWVHLTKIIREKQLKKWESPLKKWKRFFDETYGRRRVLPHQTRHVS